MSSDRDSNFTDKVREGLDMGVEDDNKALQDKFSDMRRAALNEIPEKKSSNFWSLTVPAAGIIASAMVFVFVMTFQSPSENLDFSLSNLDVLLESEDLDMLEIHDLEFYVWLERELDAQSG